MVQPAGMDLVNRRRCCFRSPLSAGWNTTWLCQQVASARQVKQPEKVPESPRYRHLHPHDIAVDLPRIRSFSGFKSSQLAMFPPQQGGTQFIHKSCSQQPTAYGELYRIVSNLLAPLKPTHQNYRPNPPPIRWFLNKGVPPRMDGLLL